MTFPHIIIAQAFDEPVKNLMALIHISRAETRNGFCWYLPRSRWDQFYFDHGEYDSALLRAAQA